MAIVQYSREMSSPAPIAYRFNAGFNKILQKLKKFYVTLCGGGVGKGTQIGISICCHADVGIRGVVAVEKDAASGF